MKKNDRVAHAPHCYWHRNQFQLWRRAPRHQVEKWEGLPQLASKPPKEDWTDVFDDDVRVSRGVERREKVDAEIRETRRLLKEQKADSKNPSGSADAIEPTQLPTASPGFIEATNDTPQIPGEILQKATTPDSDNASTGNQHIQCNEDAEEEI